MEEILQHYGILGMKWGIRNPIGPDGLIRKNGAPQSGKTELVSKDYAKKKTLSKAKAKELSSAELQEYITRVGLERKFNELKASDKSKGQKMFEKLLKSVGTAVATEIVSSQFGKEKRDFDFSRSFNVLMADLLSPNKKK